MFSKTVKRYHLGLLDKVQISKLILTKTGALAGKILKYIFLFCMCFVVLYPLIYMISVSLRTVPDLYDPTVIWVPRHWTLDNYKMVWQAINYLKTLVQTVFLTTFSTFLNVSTCAIIGYGFARFRFRFKGLLFGLVIFSIIVPSQSIAIPLFVQYYAFDFFGLGQIGRLFTGEPLTINLLNTPFTLFLPAMFGQGIRSGLFIYIFRQFFRGMPRELEDAAYIDGCGVFRTFIRIMAVNAIPAFISCILFSFVWYWNDYYLSNLYFNDARTLSTALGSLQDMLRSMGMDFYTDPYLIVAQMQAACILTILPLIILFIVLQRQFTQSIDKTGIVG